MKNFLISKRPYLFLPLLFILLVSAVAIVPVRAQTASCTSAGSTGLTAAISASHGQYITGTINATGCDIGVYVGPGASGAVIAHATVTGANDHGIFVQDASNVTIYGNTVEGNGVSPHSCPAAPAQPTGPCISEDKAIELAGASHSTVEDNVVVNNRADGGIGIADDGAIDPGAPNNGTSSPGQWNLVIGNSVENNTSGCGIVVASYNSAGVLNNYVGGNTVIGTWLGAYNPRSGPPFVGGIVVAADTPGAKAEGNTVFGNTIIGSLIPGVVVHSNAPGDFVNGTVVFLNTITHNGQETAPNDPVNATGIEVVAEAAPGMPSPPVLTDTTVLVNTINGNVYGLWTCNATGTVAMNELGSVTHSTGTCPSK